MSIIQFHAGDTVSKKLQAKDGSFYLGDEIFLITEAAEDITWLHAFYPVVADDPIIMDTPRVNRFFNITQPGAPYVMTTSHLYASEVPVAGDTVIYRGRNIGALSYGQECDVIRVGKAPIRPELGCSVYAQWTMPGDRRACEILYTNVYCNRFSIYKPILRRHNNPLITHGKRKLIL